MTHLYDVLFEYGNLCITNGAIEVLTRQGPLGATALYYFMRHLKGDWGEVCDEDKQLNDEAVKNGGRLLSAYMVGDDKIWIITEADRSATTILRPEEY